MTTTAPLCGCGRPVADNAMLCSRKPISPTDVGGCTERLARDLGDIGALADEVQTTRLRQARTGGAASGVLSRAHERPLPWNEAASEAADVLRSTVVGWVRVVLEERGGKMPTDEMQSMGVFLLGNLEWLRHHPDAAECADEIGHATGTARRVIDLAPGKVYIGPCDPHGKYNDQPCTVDIYARQGRTEAACPACGLIWNVANRREVMLEAAQDHLATAVELSRFLSIYGEPLTAKRIREWALRDKLVAHGKDAGGHALYRVSEVVTLLATMGKGKAA